MSELLKTGPGIFELLKDGDTFQYPETMKKPYELTAEDQERFDSMNLDPEDRKIAEAVFIKMKPPVVTGHAYSLDEITAFLETVWKTPKNSEPLQGIDIEQFLKIQ